MHMRRLTRLTNAFSKKWENLWAAYCLHFAYYNFWRIHQTLRVIACDGSWDRKRRVGTGGSTGRCGLNVPTGSVLAWLFSVVSTLAVVTCCADERKCDYQATIYEHAGLRKRRHPPQTPSPSWLPRLCQRNSCTPYRHSPLIL